MMLMLMILMELKESFNNCKSWATSERGSELPFSIVFHRWYDYDYDYGYDYDAADDYDDDEEGNDD